MQARRLSTSLAYPLSTVDPSVDSTRDEGEARMVHLRAVLHLVAESVNMPALVDAASDASFGALLASRRKAEDGRPILESMLAERGATPPPAICLVRPAVTILRPHEADELPENERRQCIAIEGDQTVALPSDTAIASHPHVIVTVLKHIAGGARDAKMDIERVRADCVKISTVSSSGARKYMTSGPLPQAEVDKLFAHAGVCVGDTEDAGPLRANLLPEYAKKALVDFLERKVRLQVLCTAATAAPVTRPVVLDRVSLRAFSQKSTNWISVRASLHPSSGSCICGAHGMRFDCAGRVDVNVETCGRMLQQHCSGGMRCPCHRNEIDEKGNARLSIDNICTAHTAITVTCFHRIGTINKRGVVVDEISMNAAERLELSTLLVNTAEFVQRTRSFFHRGVAVNRTEIARHAAALGDKLRNSTIDIERAQLEREDEEATNPRSMLQKDMIAVDLLRESGVFRHTVKRGTNRGTPYLQRRKRADNTPPLKAHELDLVSTHGHLFRKG